MKNNKNEMSRIDDLFLSIGIDELPEIFKIKYDQIIEDSSDQAQDHLSIIVTKLVENFSGLKLIITLLESLKDQNKKNKFLNKTLGHIFSKTTDADFTENTGIDFIKKTKEKVIEYGLKEARKATLEQKDWQEVLTKWHAVEERFTGTEPKESLFDQIEKSAFDTIEKQKFQEILNAIGVDQEKNRKLLESAKKLIADRNTRVANLFDLRSEWLSIEQSVGEKDRNHFKRLLCDGIDKILKDKQLPEKFPLAKANDFIAVKKEWHNNSKRNEVIQQWEAVRHEAKAEEIADYERLIHDHELGLEFSGILSSGDPLKTVMDNVITPIQKRLKPLQTEIASAMAVLREKVNLLKEKKEFIQKLIQLENLLGSKNTPVIKLKLKECIKKTSRLIQDAETIIGKPDSNTVDGLKEQIKDVNSRIKEAGELINHMNETLDYRTAKIELDSAKEALRNEVKLLKTKTSIEKNSLEELQGYHYAVLKQQFENCRSEAPNVIQGAEETISKPDLNTVVGLKTQKDNVNSKIEEVKKLINKMNETLDYRTITQETKLDRVSVPVAISPAPLVVRDPEVSVKNTVQPVKLASIADTRKLMLEDLNTLIDETKKRENKYAAQVVSWGTKNMRKKEAVKKVFEFADTMREKLTQHDQEIDINEVIKARDNLKDKFIYFKKTTNTSSFDFFGTGNPTGNDTTYIELAEKILAKSEGQLKELIESGATTVCRM